jgi:hypothetical protein
MNLLLPCLIVLLVPSTIVLVPAMREGIYWTARYIPELAPLPTEERRRLWQQCKSQAFGQWQTWAALVVFGLWIVGGPLLTGVVIWPERHGSAFLGLIVAPIGGFIFGQVRASMARPYLRAELQSKQAGANPESR